MLTLGVLAALAAAAWVYLLAGHGGYWRTDQRLPDGVDPAGWAAVVAVVPARDEAAMLPQTLPTLLAQHYPGPFEVVVVDDRSGDGTAEVAAALGRDARRPLRVVAGAPPPPGWVGKVWAMAQGVDATRPAPPSEVRTGFCAQPGSAGYVLFTDADIAWQPWTLRDLVVAAESDDQDLVSQMALLRADTAWERLIVPAFVYFFAQLYPFRRVNRPGGRTAAAAGGCMLVRRRALEAAGGLASIRGALIDDVALGALLKHARSDHRRQPSRYQPGRCRHGRCWLGLGTGVRSVRPYPHLADLWHMVARSAYTQLRYSPTLLIATVLGLLWLYLLPPVAAIVGALALAGAPGRTGGIGVPLVAAAGLVAWAAMTVSYLPVLRLYRLAPVRAPLLPLAAGLYAAMTVDSARRYHTGRGAVWKGRSHPRPRRPGEVRHTGGSADPEVLR